MYNVNAYHNLAGWLRDVRSVLGDRTELADSYYYQLRDLLEEVLELIGESDGDEDEGDIGADESDAEDVESTDADVDLEVQRSRDSGNAGTVHRRSRTRSVRKVGGSARVADAVLPDVPSAGKRRRGRATPVARARKRVKRG